MQRRPFKRVMSRAREARGGESGPVPLASPPRALCRTSGCIACSSRRDIRLGRKSTGSINATWTGEGNIAMSPLLGALLLAKNMSRKRPESKQ